MIKAILFDFDGTLINTNDLILRTFKETYDKYNIEITKDEIINLFGIPLEESLIEIDENIRNNFISDYRSRNEELHDDMVSLYEGIEKNLNEMVLKGFKLGIVSSKRYDMVIKGLKLFDIEKYFEVIVVSETTKNHKPKADPVLYACEKLGIKPNEAIMVGDSIYDLQSGINAGSYAVGVSYSIFAIEKLKNTNPYAIIDDISELFGVIEKINKI